MYNKYVHVIKTVQQNKDFLQFEGSESLVFKTNEILLIEWVHWVDRVDMIYVLGLYHIMAEVNVLEIRLLEVNYI